MTTNGLHVLAYVGADRWIAADPGAGRVLTARSPAPDDPWFQKPVRVVRWAVLTR